MISLIKNIFSYSGGLLVIVGHMTATANTIDADTINSQVINAGTLNVGTINTDIHLEKDEKLKAWKDLTTENFSKVSEVLILDAAQENIDNQCYPFLQNIDPIVTDPTDTDIAEVEQSKKINKKGLLDLLDSNLKSDDKNSIANMEDILTVEFKDIKKETLPPEADLKNTACTDDNHDNNECHAYTISDKCKLALNSLSDYQFSTGRVLVLQGMILSSKISISRSQNTSPLEFELEKPFKLQSIVYKITNYYKSGDHGGSSAKPRGTPIIINSKR